MRFFATSVGLGLLTCSLAQAQTPALSGATPTSSAASASVKSTPEQRTQRIHIEDDKTRIDEVRIGSETKSITVQPKNGLPPYQVAPVSGERSWKVLGF